jgi:hypothetical protein
MHKLIIDPETGRVFADVFSITQLEAATADFASEHGYRAVVEEADEAFVEAPDSRAEDPLAWSKAHGIEEF